MILIIVIIIFIILVAFLEPFTREVLFRWHTLYTFKKLIFILNSVKFPTHDSKRIFRAQLVDNLWASIFGVLTSFVSLTELGAGMSSPSTSFYYSSSIQTMVCGLVCTFRERSAMNFEYEFVDGEMTSHFSASYWHFCGSSSSQKYSNYLSRRRYTIGSH